MEFKGFGEYLAACTAKEIEGETYAEAGFRADKSGSRVHWNGHFVSRAYEDGTRSVTAYNH